MKIDDLNLKNMTASGIILIASVLLPANYGLPYLSQMVAGLGVAAMLFTVLMTRPKEASDTSEGQNSDFGSHLAIPIFKSALVVFTLAVVVSFFSESVFYILLVCASFLFFLSVIKERKVPKLYSKNQYYLLKNTMFKALLCWLVFASLLALHSLTSLLVIEISKLAVGVIAACLTIYVFLYNFYRLISARF